MKRNADVIAFQLAKLNEALQALLPAGTQYALIDFPDHSNVGDSAIWLGEVILLKHLTGNTPAYVCKVENFDADALNRVLPKGPILIHGGGNFGDLWRKHQDFREDLLANFKDRMIIQMPQSIKFNLQTNIDLCAKHIAAHPNFHLLVRDQQSLDLARQYFACDTHLVPDCAFGLGALEKPVGSSHDIFMLLRTDSERADYDRSPLEQVPASRADWLEEPAYFDALSKTKSALACFFSGNNSEEKKRFHYYQTLAEGRLIRGLRMLSSGKKVVTDRLHAHILSTLLDVPHVILDNNYGKVSGYINAWTKEYPGVKVATSAREALKLLDDLPS